MIRALFVLTPSESKRLIGMAVARMEEVQHAFRNANVLVSHGSTNVYVLEELLGREKLREMMNPAAYLSGIIMYGTLCSTPGAQKPPIVLIKQGVIVPPPPTMSQILQDFKADSVVIKGANAIDPEGNAAVMVANPEGGTIGWAIGSILARGIRLITPVGLEKLVPSVKSSVSVTGQDTLDYAQGKKVGMIPLSGAKVVTEIEALEILTGASAAHVASGGLNGSEGAVTLVAEGTQESIRKAIALVESCKGEPHLKVSKETCENCVHASPTQPKDFKSKDFDLFCRFQGRKETELPPYLRSR